MVTRYARVTRKGTALAIIRDVALGLLAGLRLRVVP